MYHHYTKGILMNLSNCKFIFEERSSFRTRWG